MGMKTETIEWFTPEEKLPDDNADLIGISKWGNMGEYRYHSDEDLINHWSKPEWGPVDPPVFWAYAIKGPQ